MNKKKKTRNIRPHQYPNMSTNLVYNTAHTTNNEYNKL